MRIHGGRFWRNGCPLAPQLVDQHLLRLLRIGLRVRRLDCRTHQLLTDAEPHAGNDRPDVHDASLRRHAARVRVPDPTRMRVECCRRRVPRATFMGADANRTGTPRAQRAHVHSTRRPSAAQPAAARRSFTRPTAWTINVIGQARNATAATLGCAGDSNIGRGASNGALSIGHSHFEFANVQNDCSSASPEPAGDAAVGVHCRRVSACERQSCYALPRVSGRSRVSRRTAPTSHASAALPYGYGSSLTSTPPRSSLSRARVHTGTQ